MDAKIIGSLIAKLRKAPHPVPVGIDTFLPSFV